MFYVLYNPLADNGKGKEKAEAGKNCFPNETCKEMDITDMDLPAFLKTLQTEDKVMICGGDGTLNRFVNVTYGCDYPCPIYLYKGGTGNDFIRDVAGDSKAPYVEVNGFIRSLPTVTINGKTQRYINGIGYGIDGQVCQVADEMKAAGKTNINYASLSVKLLLNGYVCPKATVAVDGKTLEYDKVWMASAMNGRYYGGGMMCAPRQDRLSGEVSVVVMHDSGKLKTLMVFPSIFKGEHIKHTEIVSVRKGRSITVSFDRPTALQIDGETVIGVTSYTVEAPVN